MPLKIVRNDITKMNTQAIVNPANSESAVGSGCDHAVYLAAGFEQLISYRKEKIGSKAEGEVFLTPGFDLPQEYIIHAVTPLYRGGSMGEEEKLRSCYRKSLLLAKKTGIRSIAFPLLSSGSFGYPQEESMRIAVDEINAFLLENDMDITLVVFGDPAVKLGKKLYTDLESYIDRNYVIEAEKKEYGACRSDDDEESGHRTQMFLRERPSLPFGKRAESRKVFRNKGSFSESRAEENLYKTAEPDQKEASEYLDFSSVHEEKLQERIRHMSDSFSEYLFYLIQRKGLDNAEVYKRGIVDRKTFSKIKNNPDYHPQKLTVLCLCIGAMLNLDESKDLLSRAGYALSPCDKTDIIFSYFIENEIYDMIELDIQLEEHDLPCIIS